MRGDLIRCLIAGAAVLSIQSFEVHARACAGPACPGGGLVPGDGATLPANAPGLVWMPSRPGSFDIGQLTRTDAGAGDGADAGPPAPFELTVRGDAGASIPLDVRPLGFNTVTLVPRAPLAAGLTYTFHDAQACVPDEGGLADRFTFSATTASELPTGLGELSAGAVTTGPLWVAASAECTRAVNSVQAEVSLALSDSASPWRDAFLYSTYVDGRIWGPSMNVAVMPKFGGSWRGRGKDLVYAPCEPDRDEDRGLSEGTHTVEMRAVLAGMDSVELRSNRVTVTLLCPSKPDGSAPDGAAPDGAAPDGAMPDRSVPDGGMRGAGGSGGASHGAGGSPSDAGVLGEPAGRETSDNCDCRISDQRTSRPSLVAVLAALCAAAGLRRRSQRRNGISRLGDVLASRRTRGSCECRP